MVPYGDVGEEGAGAGPRDGPLAVPQLLHVAGPIRRLDVPARPRRQDRRYVLRVGSIRQKVIGAVEGDEALRMPGHGIEAGGVLDGDDRVHGGVHEEEGRLERADHLLHVLAPEVVQEVLLHREGPASDVHLRLALGFDFLFGGLHVLQDVLGGGRSPDGRDGPDRGE